MPRRKHQILFGRMSSGFRLILGPKGVDIRAECRDLEFICFLSFFESCVIGFGGGLGDDVSFFDRNVGLGSPGSAQQRLTVVLRVRAVMPHAATKIL